MTCFAINTPAVLSLIVASNRKGDPNSPQEVSRVLKQNKTKHRENSSSKPYLTRMDDDELMLTVLRCQLTY